VGDLPEKCFDSYIKSNDFLFEGDARLLDADNRCIVPSDTGLCICLTSADVIHSWTLYNFFVKVDAMRGILRVINFIFPVVGVYYGQCSEICGANHRFIPIVLEVSLFNIFKIWCFSFFTVVIFLEIVF